MSSLRGRIETRPRSLRDRPAPGCYAARPGCTWPGRPHQAHEGAPGAAFSRGNQLRLYNAGMDAVPPDRDLAAIGLLQDPLRRALYRHVVAAGGEVSRNQAAEAVGVARGLAAFHLDKLVEAGLLEAAFRRLGERRGPGAGRPAKLYRRAAGQVGASLPPRTYETAAHLLAETVEQAGADLALQATARQAGARAGR